MRNLLTTVLLLATCAIFAQTSKIGFGSGLYEDSVGRGIGVPVEVSLSQEVTSGFGILGAYSYIFTREGAVEQVRAEAFHEYAVDHSLSLRARLGVATQFEDEIHPSFGFDILASASDDIQIGLMWSPVVKGRFRALNEGWTHTVLLGTLIKL